MSFHIICVESVRIWSFSGPYFSAFGLSTEIYGVNLRIQSECGEIWTRGHFSHSDKYYKFRFLDKNHCTIS